MATHGRAGAVGLGALGALDLIRLGAPGKAAELLTAYPIDPDWMLGRSNAGARHAAHLADPAALLEVARSFARYGMPLHAAEAATLARVGLAGHRGPSGGSACASARQIRN